MLRGFVSAALAIILAATAAPARADSSWPNHPITLIVGFAAGGGTDVLARIVAKKVSEILGQQIIIENVGGAGGTVASARVAKAVPDGYTLLMGSRAEAINQTLYKHPPYNVLTDLVPVVLLGEQPTILVTRNESPFSTMPEFIDYVKKNHSKMQYASAGVGSTGQIDCALLNAALGVDVTHVPYRGGSAALQDVIGGRVDYLCTLTGSVVSLVKGKSLKAIAVLTKDRAPMLPEVKSSWEQGFKDLEASTWFGFMAPKGTPDDIVAKLQAATAKALDDKDVQTQMLNAGATVMPPERRTTEYYRQMLPKEIEKNGAPLRAAGISIE